VAGRFPLYTDADVRGSLIVEAFEEIAAREHPFSPYPIVRIKPRP
jgi:hypothetical protein